MDKLKVLVVEDDELEQVLISKQLKNCLVDVVGDFKTAKEKLGSGDFDLCFLDLKLGREDEYSGLKLIPIAKTRGFYSVVMSSCDGEDVVARAYELGCNDFYSKGNEESSIDTILGNFIRNRKGLDTDRIFSERFITRDPVTETAITEALKYAPTGLPMLILGPSGTGKTLLAKVLHDQSGREGEFVSINCSSYTEDLLEAELFGYRRGAFTGATENRKGKLLQAHKGTLFLDEIGSMSLSMQAKLLKAIEERTFYPLGSERPEASDFRVISGTLEDLEGLVSGGKLRFDFFQRIHGLTVNLNPLAQRKDDILPLIGHFTRGDKQLSFTPEAKAALLDYPWPGNIRELERIVKILMSGGSGRITLELLRKHLSKTPHVPAASGLLTTAQYRYALKHGLYKTVDRLAGEIVRRNLNDNGEKKSKTLSDLKISNRLLYSVLNKSEKPQKEEASRDSPSRVG